MSSRMRLVVATVTVAMVSCGCNWSTPDDRAGTDLVVVTSTDVWGSIASVIGGPHVEVTAFISSPAQDPHSFQPSARDVLAVSKADVVIENGGGYDDFMDRLLDASTGNATVLNAVDISGLAAAGDGAAVNEHVWYDLATVGKVAHRIATAFASADPAHSQRYLGNARAFTDTVDALRARQAGMRARLAGTPVAITEPVPVYMLHAIGGVDKTPEQFSAAVENGDEVAVSVLEDTLTLFTEHQVSALVYNRQTTGPLTDQVEQAAQDAGVPEVGVTETLPAGRDYLSWMRANLKHLDTALSSR